MTKQDPSPTFGKLVSKARNSKGMTRAELAVSAGLHPSTVDRAEQNKAVDFPTIQALASVLGLDVGVLARAAARPASRKS